MDAILAERLTTESSLGALRSHRSGLISVAGACVTLNGSMTATCWPSSRRRRAVIATSSPLGSKTIIEPR